MINFLIGTYFLSSFKESKKIMSEKTNGMEFIINRLFFIWFFSENIVQNANFKALVSSDLSIKPFIRLV